MSKPLCIDLFCGLGGWAHGFLAEGWDVIGFDIERHCYGSDSYPAQLVLQDVVTLHGSQFNRASVIVASPPCQEFSKYAMPFGSMWREHDRMDDDGAPPGRYVKKPCPSTYLFWTCFRIASEAGVPLVVENVKGAQRWVGRAQARYGSYFLWGAVDSIGGRIVRRGALQFGAASLRAAGRSQKFNPDGTEHPQGSWFKIADSVNRGAQKREGRNFHAFENGLGSSPSFNGAAHETRHVKNGGSGSWFGESHGETFPVQAGNPVSVPAGLKVPGVQFSGYGTPGRKGDSRKAASAQIAKIPFELAAHIARVFKPVGAVS